MTKLISTKPLGNDKFEILFSRDGAEEKQIVSYRLHRISGDDAPMPFIVPEDAKFFDVWGADPKLRRELKESLDAQFQTA